MKQIQKVKLHNFKRFQDFELELSTDINLIIGDNESGKSTILTAIDLTITGSKSKVEGIGLEHLFNSAAITSFLSTRRNIKDLPTLSVEIFLTPHEDELTDGKNNSDKRETNGIRLLCRPNDEFTPQIQKILSNPDCLFPFEYYTIEFWTFAKLQYNNYRRHLKHILIDNSKMNSEYAMREYIKDLYNASLTDSSERNTHSFEYRTHKKQYKTVAFSEINKRLGGTYEFALKSNAQANVEADLTILDGNISIDNKGKGKQCIIKTQLALTRKSDALELVLLEEPENHLSHGNMKKLIATIQNSSDKQIIVATHSDLVSTRLDLRKSILLNSGSSGKVTLSGLSEDTARFFTKAPDNNILEFILSKKVILVEGDSEYILANQLFKLSQSQSLNDQEIHVISVDGTSFKRYLDIALLLQIKTAVITDNDGDHQKNCVKRYEDYTKKPFISVFADTDDSRRTFEMCMYRDNSRVCDELFKEGRISLSVEEYMLQNKADVAYTLLDKKADELNVPQYIQNAFSWINS